MNDMMILCLVKSSLKLNFEISIDPSPLHHVTHRVTLRYVCTLPSGVWSFMKLHKANWSIQMSPQAAIVRASPRITSLVSRRAFHATRARLSSPYHYPEGPYSNLPFNTKTRFFAFRFWAYCLTGFCAPFGIAGASILLLTLLRLDSADCFLRIITTLPSRCRAG